jgi:hypothetical protein
MFISVTANAGKSYPKAGDIETLKLLNNEEISKIFKGGNSIIGMNLKFNKECIQNYYNDGTYDGTVASGKKKVAGKWKVENNMICHLSKKKNKKICRAIYKDGDFFVELNKDKMTNILKFKVK